MPIFHGLATEDEDLRWDYFVRHYAADERQRLDTKFVPDRDGVLYPRAGTLGGCTAHNAMITVYPQNSDWDRIAQITGDASWGSQNMRQYFERLERYNYIKRPRAYPGNSLLAPIARWIPGCRGFSVTPAGTASTAGSQPAWLIQGWLSGTVSCSGS